MAEEQVNHPKHYNSHPSGIEAIDIIEHFDFCIGSALKYLMRYQHKGAPIQDLRKSAWYFRRAAEAWTRDVVHSGHGSIHMKMNRYLAGEPAHSILNLIFLNLIKWENANELRRKYISCALMVEELADKMEREAR